MEQLNNLIQEASKKYDERVRDIRKAIEDTLLRFSVSDLEQSRILYSMSLEASYRYHCLPINNVSIHSCISEVTTE